MLTDTPGLARDANYGEGMGNKFLSHIKNADGIFHVVRAFDFGETRPDFPGLTAVNPIRDIDIINKELMIKDQDTIQT